MSHGNQPGVAIDQDGWPGGLHVCQVNVPVCEGLHVGQCGVHSRMRTAKFSEGGCGGALSNVFCEPFESQEPKFLILHLVFLV